MSVTSEKYRRALKEKARLLAHGDPHQRVDASSWTPPELEQANIQTGERPVSRRQFKAGGKVDGERQKGNLGRAPRKSGGKALTADSYQNRDMRDANDEREGPKHVGGFARGGKSVSDGALEGARPEKEGRLAHAKGGHVGYHVVGDKDGYVYGRKKTMAGAERAMQGVRDRGYSDRPDFHIRPITNEADYGLNQHEPRAARKSGGRTKGKTNINIVISAGKSDPASAAPPMEAAPPRPAVVPVPAGPPPGGAPAPMPPPMGGGGPTMPMPRKSGGRTPHMTAGAGSGVGRLEKLKE